MQGIVYKELCQNRAYLLFGLFMPAGMTVLSALMGLVIMSGEGFSAVSFFSGFLTGNKLFFVRIMLMTIGYFVLGLTSSSVFAEDESRRQSFFMASVPDGARRALYGKYVFLFMTYGLVFVSAVFADSFIGWLTYCVTGKAPGSMMSFFLILLFVQMLFRAFDIPFIARFGTKAGAAVKAAVIVAALLGVIIYIMFAPSVNELGDVFNQFLEKLADGSLAEETVFVISIFPLFSVGAYYLSFRISCKVWLKGAANHEK